MNAVYENSTPSLAAIKFEAAKIKHGRTSLVNDERLGPLEAATLNDNIGIVHQTVLNDLRIKNE